MIGCFAPSGEAKTFYLYINSIKVHRKIIKPEKKVEASYTQ